MRRKSWILIKEEQEFRYRKYPKDRIPFLPKHYAAERDQSDMKSYMNGEITLKMLCVRIALNNSLPKVSEEAMLNELKITGWLR